MGDLITWLRLRPLRVSAPLRETGSTRLKA